jgi:hypothetical protein
LIQSINRILRISKKIPYYFPAPAGSLHGRGRKSGEQVNPLNGSGDIDALKVIQNR